MAILTALFSLVGKQIGKIVQAIFGWAITALFGRLPSSQQTALSAALIASIAWPLLVVGAFLPGVAAWALAFLPLHKWLGDLALRLIWISLALLIPIAVGAIARWVTPPAKLKGGVMWTLLNGYALTVGYFVAFVITAVTVPIVQLLSLARGWNDEHVYVQSKPHHYDQVLSELTLACDAAGVHVVSESIPTAMQLATKAMKWFARAAMDPVLDAEPKRLVGKELEVYLYPADLLLRGDAKKVARVRAAMTRTKIETHAHLVSEPAAQAIEDELEGMGGILSRHAHGESIGSVADTRLHEIEHEADRVTMSFESWTILQTGIRRIERALEDARQKRPEEPVMNEDNPHAIAAPPAAGPNASTKDLLEECLSEGKDLIRLEASLAKDEALTELRGLRSTLVAFLGAIALGAGAIAALVSVLVLATSVVVGLVVAGVLLVGTAGAAYMATKTIPEHPMEKTRERLVHDANNVRERLA